MCPTSGVHRIGGRRQLGLKFDDRRGFLRWEAHSLRALIDAGVRVPAPLKLSTQRTPRALLYEWIEADPHAALTREVADEAHRVLAHVYHKVRGHLPRAEVLTREELLTSSRARAEKERMARLLLSVVDGFGRNDGAAHGDMWPGNLIVSAAGDIVPLDPKLQYGPRCFDLVGYCFHAPLELIPEAMLDDLDTAGRTTRVVGVIRELARCPHVPAPPWIAWALQGGRPPAPARDHPWQSRTDFTAAPAR